jgi:hypothetical protein
MKRLILRITVMLIAFAIGFGMNQIISSLTVPSPPSNPTPTILIAPPPPPHVPVAPKLARAADPILILDYDEEKIDRWGYFYILGSTPKEFADFDSMAIGLTGPMHGDIGSRGFISVEIRSGKTTDVAHANIVYATEQRLFFATSPAEQSGVEYWFDGAFLRNDFEAVAGKNKAVLRGTFTKVKDGKKIAQRTVSFRMEHMGC